MAWFGGAIIGSFCLLLTVQTLGPAAQPFIDQLVNSSRVITLVNENDMTKGTQP